VRARWRAAFPTARSAEGGYLPQADRLLENLRSKTTIQRDLVQRDAEV
jgi:hypothetical protein